jgi:hypothetical protein
MLSRAGVAHAGDDWLARLNQYRAMVKLAPVREENNLNLGESQHARYLVENYSAALREHRPLGVDMHIEDHSNPWYSYSGFVAGRASDVLLAEGTRAPSWAIDDWITAPFHRFPLLRPDLNSVGYGGFCQNGVCGAAINTQSGATTGNRRFIRRMINGEPITGDSEALGGGSGSHYAKPVEFPPDGSTVEVLSLSNEWPDPTKSCSGYKFPVGLPITIQFGWNLTPKITAGSLRENGKPIRACAFHADDYTNPDPIAEKVGRAGLKWAGAVVILPQEPLHADARYSIHAVVDDVAYDWAFFVRAPLSP